MMEPLLPVSGSWCGRWRNHRQVIDGIIHRLSTGVQWRNLPERFGPRESVYKRHPHRSADGAWKMLLSRMQAADDAVGRIDWDVSVDSMAVRTHQHAMRREESDGGRGP